MKKYFFWISVLTLFFSVLLLFLRFSPKPYGDGEYHEGALALIHGTGFLFSKGWFPVVYYAIPYFIVDRLGSESYYEASVVFNGIINCVSVSLLFIVLRKRFGLIASFIFVTITFLLPIHVYYSLGVLAETPAFGLIALFIYFIYRNENEKLSRTDFWGAVISLVCFLGSRQIYLTIFPLFLLYYVVFGIFLRKRSPALDSVGSVMVISFLLFSFVQWGVNAIGNESDGEYKSYVFKNGLIISRSELRDEPLNWMHWTQSLRKDSKDFDHYKEVRQEFKTACGQYFENCSYGDMGAWYLRDVWQNKLITIRQAVAKVAVTYSFFSSGALQKNLFEQSKTLVVLHVAINLVNYAILVFFILYLRDRTVSIGKPLSLIFVLAGLTTGVLLHAESRYLFPARPFIFIGASIAMYSRYALPLRAGMAKYLRIRWEE